MKSGCELINTKKKQKKKNVTPHNNKKYGADTKDCIACSRNVQLRDFLLLLLLLLALLICLCALCFSAVHYFPL